MTNKGKAFKLQNTQYFVTCKTTGKSVTVTSYKSALAQRKAYLKVLRWTHPYLENPEVTITSIQVTDPIFGTLD